MTGADVVTILPLIVLTAAAVLLMLLIAFRRHHSAVFVLTLVGLVLAFGMLPVAAQTDNEQVTPLLIFDRFAIFYMGLLFAAAFAVAVLAYGYLDGRETPPEEFYLLLLLATLGAAVLAAARHFASFFLGLELLTVALYALIAYPRVSRGNVEAGLKYLVLAAASAAFLLFGMALVYAEVGTMEFPQIAARLDGLDSAATVVLLTGLGMLVVGIGFKLAVVPFHMWTPDVYEGAPAPVAGFIASVSKGAVFALLLRFSADVDLRGYDALFWAFAIIAVASMIGGNVLALLQDNVKRILAYSSIAHLGFLLVAYLAAESLAVTAITFYLIAYFAAILTAFGVITVLSDQERDADSIRDYRGLFQRKPWLAGVLTASLLSLAGIPFLAGFVGKFYLVAAGAESALWVLVVTLVVASVIGLFYYLRIVSAMYATMPEPLEWPTTVRPLRVAPASLPAQVLLAALTATIIWLGVYPSPLIDAIQNLAGSLT